MPRRRDAGRCERREPGPARHRRCKRWGSRKKSATCGRTPASSGRSASADSMLCSSPRTLPTPVGPEVGHSQSPAGRGGLGKPYRKPGVRRRKAHAAFARAGPLLLYCAAPRCTCLVRTVPPFDTADFAAKHDAAVLRCLARRTLMLFEAQYSFRGSSRCSRIRGEFFPEAQHSFHRDPGDALGSAARTLVYS